MAYEAKNFESLIGTAGFSDQLLKNHFTLYQGYVTNTNKVMDSLAALAKEGKAATPEYAELTRRLGWEFNGMRLHEYYFGNMKKGGSAIDTNSEFYKQTVKSYGSFDNFEKNLKAVGTMRGVGWAIAYYDAEASRLQNVWVNEHDVGHFAGAAPLLIMDVFEHAFMIDYGLKRADYIEAFWKAIDWASVSKRFDAATRK